MWTTVLQCGGCTWNWPCVGKWWAIFMFCCAWHIQYFFYLFIYRYDIHPANTLQYMITWLIKVYCFWKSPDSPHVQQLILSKKLDFIIKFKCICLPEFEYFHSKFFMHVIYIVFLFVLLVSLKTFFVKQLICFKLFLTWHICFVPKYLALTA